MDTSKQLKHLLLILGLAGSGLTPFSALAETALYCGATPVLPDSESISPIETELYVINSNSDFAAAEEFRFRYKGDNIFQVHANFNIPHYYFISSADFSNMMYIPVQGADVEAVDGENPIPGNAYPVNWTQPPFFSTSIAFHTGKVLLTLVLDDGAQQGDLDAGSLTFDVCDPELEEPRPVFNSKKRVKVETPVTGVGANGAISRAADGTIYANEFGSFTPDGGTGTQIFKVSPEGEVSVHATGLKGPVGSHIDSEGNLYVINANSGGSGFLVKVSPDGRWENVAEIAGRPINVTQDDQGNFYITHATESHITKIDIEGQQSVFAQHEDLAGALGVLFDHQAQVFYASSIINGKILRIDLYGNVKVIAQVPATVGYIALLNGRIFATGQSSHYLYAISKNGRVKRVAGDGVADSLDGISGRARFSVPNGITVDQESRILYVLESGGLTDLRSIKFRKFRH